MATPLITSDPTFKPIKELALAPVVVTGPTPKPYDDYQYFYGIVSIPVAFEIDINTIAVALTNATNNASYFTVGPISFDNTTFVVKIPVVKVMLKGAPTLTAFGTDEPIVVTISTKRP